MRPVYLVLLLLAALTTACVALPPQPEEPAMNALQAKQEGAAVEAAPAAALTSEEAATSADAAITAITGEVAYRPRIALPPDAVIEVELHDISRADAPARIIGQQRIETGGQQVPVPFAVEYDLSQINPDGVYVLVARISEGGTMTWRNPEILRVITGGWPTDQVEILVQQLDN
jgi:uncharacterized lipoprotein YbaY